LKSGRLPLRFPGGLGRHRTPGSVTPDAGLGRCPPPDAGLGNQEAAQYHRGCYRASGRLSGLGQPGPRGESLRRFLRCSYGGDRSPEPVHFRRGRRHNRPRLPPDSRPPNAGRPPAGRWTPARRTLDARRGGFRPPPPPAARRPDARSSYPDFSRRIENAVIQELPRFFPGRLREGVRT